MPLILINSAAAPFNPTPFHLLTAHEVETQWNVIAKGSFFCTQAAIRRMVQNKSGVIINILSQAMQGEPPKGFSAYVMAKCAVDGLGKSIAAEYSHLGIRVLAYAPSFLDTSLTQAWEDRIRTAILSRLGPPLSLEEVALRVLALAQDTSLPGKGECYSD